MYLHGGTGRGKTAAVLALVATVPDSLYQTVEDLVEAERTHDLHLWQLVAHYNLVVVDELGCRRQVSDWEYSVVKRVADLREQKATVWISNHPPERIRALFDDRIASRLLCGTWFALEGHDRRQEDG